MQKASFSFVIASASLVTSITTLLIVPNSIFQWWTHRHWQENIKVIRLNTNDYTYIYNGNYDPVFFDRIEVKSSDVGQLKYIEIGKAVEGKSYLVFTHKGVAFKGMYSGAIDSLLENGVLPNKYEMVTINVDNPFPVMLGVAKPTMYATEAKLFFEMGLTRAEIEVQAKSFIVKKDETYEQESNSTPQPMVSCIYTPKTDLKTGKKIEN